jgi:hypothetical protein
MHAELLLILPEIEVNGAERAVGGGLIADHSQPKGYAEVLLNLGQGAAGVPHAEQYAADVAAGLGERELVPNRL